MDELPRKNEPRLRSYQNTGYDGNFDDIQQPNKNNQPEVSSYGNGREKDTFHGAYQGTSVSVNWKRFFLVTLFLLAVLIIAVVAFGIFYVLTNDNADNDNATNGVPSSSKSPTPTSSRPFTSSATSTSSPTTSTTLGPSTTTTKPPLSSTETASTSSSLPSSAISIKMSTSTSVSSPTTVTSTSISTEASTSTTPYNKECHEGEFKCLVFEECIPSYKQCDGTDDCMDRSDEWYDCGITQRPWLPLDLEVRLIDNDEVSLTRGRVEVRRRGQSDYFGTVCGQGWTIEDATVVCRMLNPGFIGTAHAYKTAVFGPGTGDILLTNVVCHGNESNIGDCMSRGFGYGLVHCAHSQDAGVTCDGSQVITSPVPPVQGPHSDVRLIRGSSCLSGMLQVYHEEEWRFVCSDYFGSAEATVVCRMLGYNAGIGYIDYFRSLGYGDGLYWLDDVQCHGNESHIFNCSSNDFGEHNCDTFQAIGIFCPGLEEIDCEPQKPCTQSVNCSFETDDCCFKFIPPEVEGHGTTPWVRYNAWQILQTDHTTQNSSGYVAYYQNVFGNKEDLAFMDHPNITLRGEPQKLEFYYLIISNDVNALSVNLLNDDTEYTDVWKPTHVTKELEEMWLYGCLNIPQQEDEENAAVRFIARRGPLSNRIIALDDVSLSGGVCHDISNTRCDFDNIGSCNTRIICSDCDQDYRWRLVGRNTLEETDDDYSNADASYGRPGKTARLEFHVTGNIEGKHGLRFKYRYHGNVDNVEEQGGLKVLVDSEEPILIWQEKVSDIADVWQIACVAIKDVLNDFTITFEATHGTHVLGDIALDDVELTDYCPFPGSCDFDEETCGYVVETFHDTGYYWNISGQEGREISDTQIPERLFQVFDNEAQYGSWTKLMSPFFNITSISYRLMFQFSKFGPGSLKVYAVSNDVIYNFGVDFLPMTGDTEGTEDVCIDFGDLVLEDAQLVFESVKGSDWNNELYNNKDRLSIDNIEIAAGSCPVQSTCTFEEDYRLCNYHSLSIQRNGSNDCISEYKWRRIRANANHDIVGDSTFGNETGHYLAVSTAYGDENSASAVSIRLKNTDRTQDMHVAIFTRIFDDSKNDSSLHLVTRGANLDLTENHSSGNGWKPNCVNVAIETNETLVVNVTASQIDAAIDNVSLEPGKCPEQSERCVFLNSLLCGYMTNGGGRFYKSLNESFVRLSQTGAILTSPSFQVDSQLCISVEVRGPLTDRSNSIESSQHLEVSLVKDTDESILPLRNNILPVLNGTWKNLQYVQAFIPFSRYQLRFTANIGDHNSIDIKSVDVTSVCSTLECPHKDDIACDDNGLHFCMPLLDACTNQHLCSAATAARCSTSDCDFEDDYSCGWMKVHAELQNNSLVLGEERLTYAETPLVDINTDSCLTFTLLSDFNDNALRIVTNSSGSLEEIDNLHQLSSQGHVQDIKVDLPLGKYSIIFEARHNRDAAAYLLIDNVTVSQEMCTNTYTTGNCQGSLCSFVGDNGIFKTICIQDDVFCDKYIDCPSASDEEQCDYSFDCNFDTSTCGYDLSEGIDHVHTPYKIDAIDMMIPPIAGMKNEFILLYDSAHAEEVEMTAGPFVLSDDICNITLDVFCQTAPYVNISEASALMSFITHDNHRHAYHYEMELNMESDWTNMAIPIEDLLWEHHAPNGQYVPTIQLSGTGVIIAIDNFNIVGCHGDETSTQTTTSTTQSLHTETHLPEEFPKLAILENAIKVQTLDKVVLSCLVKYDDGYDNVLHWYKNDFQIARGSEIINQEFDELFGHDNTKIAKYDVSLGDADISGYIAKYMLTINRLIEDDADIYTCKLVVDNQSINVSVEVTVEADFFAKTDDSCYKNTISICHDLGFEKVMTPGPIGIYDVSESSQQLEIALRNLEQFGEMSNQCKMSLYTLHCGIYSPKCHDGRTIPVCREHCEETLKMCLHDDNNYSSLASLEYDCKFLPYLSDMPSCLPMFKGCNFTYTAQEGRIMTENYPRSYPKSSECSWNISVAPYHFIKIDVDDYGVGIGNDKDSNCSFKIHDPSIGHDLTELRCGEMLQPFNSTKNNLTLEFVSDDTSSGRGFNLRYKQIPIGVCLSFPGEESVRLSSSALSDTNCKSFKVYLYNGKDTLVIKVMFLSNGCMQISNAIGNGMNTRACNTTSIIELKTNGYVDIHVDSNDVVYEIIAQKVPYERKVSNVALDHRGAIEVTSEGDIGHLCGSISQTTANVICESLGLGWPALGSFQYKTQNDLPPFVSNINCNGDEKDITECQFSFEASNDGLCIILQYFGLVPSIICSQRNLTCDFQLSTCGYESGNEIQLSRIYGLYIQPSGHNTGIITSPEFSYSEGVSIHFHYSIRRAVGEKLVMKLRNSKTNKVNELWRWENYATYGKHEGCVPLPSPVQTNGSYHIVFEYASGDELWMDSNAEYTGVQSIQLSFVPCIQDIDNVHCNFENLDTCADIVSMEAIACQHKDNGIQGTVITSGKTFSRGNDWIHSDHTYSLSDGHYLLINEGTTIPFFYVTDNMAEMGFLRFYFAIDNGLKNSSNVNMSIAVGDLEIYTAKGLGNGWIEACIDISNYKYQQLMLSFGDSVSREKDDGEHSFASLAIDDITISSRTCGYYLNCNFEDDCHLLYHTPDDTISWILGHSRLTYSILNGYYMKANFTISSDEGDIAVLESENITDSDEIRCLHFQYLISGSQNPGSLHVKLFTENESSEVFVANGNHDDIWFTFHVPIDQNVTVIQFIATKGNGFGSMLLDNVEFTTGHCSSSLNDVDYCSFTNPKLCGLMLDERTAWKHGYIADIHGHIEYDADFNDNGYFYFIRPSEVMSDTVHNELVFKVNVTTMSALQFSYFAIGGTSISFNVSINGIKQEVPVEAENDWMLTDCIELPKDFIGDIAIGIENEDKDVELIAIDNVKLVDAKKCKGPSLSCDFSTGEMCNYHAPEGNVERGRGLTLTGAGVMRSPTVLLSTPSCFTFGYSATSVNSVDEQAELHLYHNGRQLWSTYGSHIPREESVQISFEAAVSNIYFESSKGGLYRLLETSVVDGSCEESLECNGFLCGDKCISSDRKCDGTIDCLDGDDEQESLCGFKFSTNFTKETNLESTGFRTSESSYVLWTLENDFNLTIKGRSRLYNTPFLVARFSTPLARPAVLESFQYHLKEHSCLQINYLGDVAYGEVDLIYDEDTEEDNKVLFKIKPSTDIRHISIPVSGGNVRVILSVYMFEIKPDLRDIPNSALFALEHVTMHAGKLCNELSIECSVSNDTLCDDKRSCYDIDEKCDTNAECYDESDETKDCGFGIECDFEKSTLCGYSNISPRRTYLDYRLGAIYPQTLWEHTESSSITRPSYDHTYQKSGDGHFITSKNFEGLLDFSRYVDVETIQSRNQTFEEDGCITFWYYLNSTAHQPKTTSAQIFVYIHYEDSDEISLVWFDYINRPIPSWIKGGANVHGKRSAKLIITAKTFIPFDGFTGVVSLDDVEFSPGECDVNKIECDDQMFQCTNDMVCIPESFVCDGETDCQDDSDEQNCDRPNGSYKLIDGDGTYGKVAYFYDGAWRPVCYQSPDGVTTEEQNLYDVNIAFHVCRELGFIGNSDVFTYKLWGRYSDINTQLFCTDDNKCHANMTSGSCDLFVFLRCSNEVCFADEVVCPGTRSKCIPKSYLCDGQQDCPNNLDETQCYCFEDDDRCIHSKDECNDKEMCETCKDRGMFECLNHQCIDLDLRCDGRRDCADSSDEYRCVQIEDNAEVSMFMNTTLTREILCVDDITFEQANMLCELAGQGEVAEIQRGFERIENGVNPSTFESTTNCFPLKLECHMPECGTTAIKDDVVEPFIVNGRDAYIEEWPWYGVLKLNGTFLCGASLIDPSWAITASHCIGSYWVHVVYTVSFGIDSRDSNEKWLQEIEVVETIGHSTTSSVWLSDDITLLKLKHPAQINNFTRPVCLPTPTSLQSIITQGSSAECFVIGQGTTEKVFADPYSRNVLPDVLQKKQVLFLSQELCKEGWATTYSSYIDSFPEKVVCVGTEAPNSPLCLGDSGGPLVCKADSGRWELFGIVSFGYGVCFHDIIPSVLTSVAAYREWIIDETGMLLGGE